MRRSMYTVLKQTYHNVMPRRVREFLYRSAPGWARQARLNLTRRLEAKAKHDEIYDQAYYRDLVEPTMALSAATISRAIVHEFAPKTVADVGCGTGRLLLEFRDLGVAGRGLELSDAALAMCRERGLVVQKFDIEKDTAPAWSVDVAISTEVAEHLPEQCADPFVGLLCQMAPCVVLTAAQPSGEIGTDHVNEQPHEYWIAKFRARGYLFDAALTQRWRSEWEAVGVAGCFYSNVMVFHVVTEQQRNA